MEFNFKNIKEVSPTTAAKFLLIVPIMIVVFNENVIQNPYLDTIADYCIIIGFSLLFCRAQVFSFFRLVNGSYKETINAVILIFIWSNLATIVGAWFVGPDPQGVQNVTYNTVSFLKNCSLLPLIGFGEEFLKLLVFFGFFSLLPGGRSFRFICSLLIASSIFGFLHAFHYPIAASIPIALGAIPTVFLTIYFKSLWPAIIEHSVWDGLHFLSHYNAVDKAFSSFLVIVVMLLYCAHNLRKGSQKKNAQQT